jgi:hypothetical protein
MSDREIAILIVASFIGGIASRVFERLSERRKREAQRREFLRLLHAEFLYWQRSGDEPTADDTQAAIAMGATGAVSNVIAAVMNHPAPWHEKEHPHGAAAQLQQENAR